jgi:hypothetical protein
MIGELTWDTLGMRLIFFDQRHHTSKQNIHKAWTDKREESTPQSGLTSKPAQVSAVAHQSAFCSVGMSLRRTIVSVSVTSTVKLHEQANNVGVGGKITLHKRDAQLCQTLPSCPLSAWQAWRLGGTKTGSTT